jgi:dihydrofolate synthase/folylpolyglutamate synthase
MADKDVELIGSLLVSAGHPVIPVDLPSPRALAASALESTLRSAGAEVLEGPASVAGAIDWFYAHSAPDDRLLVTGSHVTVAEAVRALESRDVSLRASR